MTHPTNSIDSELEIRAIFVKHTESGLDTELELFDTDAIIKEIAAKYVSRKEIEEAIGEDEKYEQMHDEPEWSIPTLSYNNVRRGVRNDLRKKLRAKLLPPNCTWEMPKAKFVFFYNYVHIAAGVAGQPNRLYKRG